MSPALAPIDRPASDVGLLNHMNQLINLDLTIDH